ncbi:MAG TPA: hypothetical protein VIX80_08175 [Candidatus Kapabacteria bacterium]
MKYIHLFVVVLFLLSSCSEDSINTSSSTNGGKPYLEVFPSSLNLNEYEYFKVKYRVSNFSYEDEVDVFGDLGNGDTVLGSFQADRQVSGWYADAGNYTLTLRAYDRFADTLLATKSIPVTIAPVTVTVSVSPVNLDTTFNSQYSTYPIFFTANTNVNNQNYFLYYEWTISGNGLNTTQDHTANTYYGYFPGPGTYTVKVRMKDSKTNVVRAIDSTTVTIRVK